jgi:uncharacterized protein YceK
MRMTATLALVSILASATGCGTLYSLVDSKIENKVYGGVQADTALISKMVSGSSGESINPGSGNGGAILALAIVIVPVADLAVSAVADTLLLPAILLWDHLTTPTPAAPAKPATP